MAILSLERLVDAAVLDGRGSVELSSGAARIHGVLREVPHLFVEGAQLSLSLQVGGERFDAVCRVLDDAVACAPGCKVALEVLRAAPAGISGIEPFDLVPLTPTHAPTLKPPAGVLTPPFGSLPPQAAFADDGAPLEDDEPTGVIGTLREMPVSEIVQTLASSRRDALVEIKPKGEQTGSLAIEKGRVVFAQKGKLVGEEAFFALFMASRGAFRIRYGRKVEQPNIQRDTTFLLLEAARVVDELTSGRHTRPPGTVPAGPAAVDAGWRVPSSSSGLFSRFFDEAGVQTTPPMPIETARFQSLSVEGITELDDPEEQDSQPTARERKAVARSSNSNP